MILARGSKFLYTRWPKPIRRKPDSLSLALSTADCTCLASPISASIFSTASLAPPCAGPHNAATPAATQAYGSAPLEPPRRTVAAEAFSLGEAARGHVGQEGVEPGIGRGG